MNLDDIMKAKEVMDEQPIPDEPRYFWDPEAEELVFWAPTKEITLEEFKKRYPKL